MAHLIAIPWCVFACILKPCSLTVDSAVSQSAVCFLSIASSYQPCLNLLSIQTHTPTRCGHSMGWLLWTVLSAPAWETQSTLFASFVCEYVSVCVCVCVRSETSAEGSEEWPCIRFFSAGLFSISQCFPSSLIASFYHLRKFLCGILLRAGAGSANQTCSSLTCLFSTSL